MSEKRVYTIGYIDEHSKNGCIQHLYVVCGPNYLMVI